MKVADVPDNEKDRLKTLSDYAILDTLPERDFDDLTKIASFICQTPIAVISLIDDSRQWFKSRVNLAPSETPRDISFCSHTILQDDVFVVPNAAADERFHDNPFVTGDFNLQFYAGAPLISPQGHRIGALCVIDHQARELTAEQKDALAALARQVIYLFELRQKAERLRETTRQAKAAVQVKGEFLANISHEIRTPLNGVIGMAELLVADAGLSEEQSDRIETIRSSGRTLLALINDVLDFSKLESGKMEIERASFDLRRATGEVLQLLTPSASAKGLTVACEINAFVPGAFEGDVTRYKQILMNLLSNAIKFTREGSIRVRVESLPSSEDGLCHQINISVQDTGIGLSPEAQQRLFQPFTQADASTTRRFGGSGLGLSICKALCERMGGSISVESEEGQGSRFDFNFKAWPIAAPLVQKLAAPTEKPATGMKILVAEDNEINQKVVTALLRRLGAEVRVANNGQEAIELLRQEMCDLILMDCHMPEVDGFEATQMILKEWAPDARPRIVALTASVNDADRTRCREVGMDSFLTKPISIAELTAELESTLVKRNLSIAA